MFLQVLMCLLLKGGHSFRPKWSERRMSLVCDSCDLETPGWEIGKPNKVEVNLD